VLFNSVERPAASTLALLGVGTVLMMLALTLQPALVALGRQATVTAGWTIGLLVFLLMLAGPATPSGPLADALAAQVGGPLVVALCMANGIRRSLRHADLTPQPAVRPPEGR
jgi:O-antigen/teichoic acid export membrane protein